MAGTGGKREGAGRKSKAEELKANNIFLNALKVLYDLENEVEAQQKFIREKLMESQRGQLFIAEHLFGKPKETIDNNVNINNFDLKEVIKFKE